MSSHTQNATLRPFQRAIFGLYEGVNKLGVLDSSLGRAIFSQAYFLYKRYYEDAFHILAQQYPAIFRNATILDIGANVGYTAALFSRAAGGTAQVIAFEPDSECLVSLKHNCSREIAAGKVTVVEAAVGDHNGHVEFWRNPGNSSDNRTVTDTFRTHLHERSGKGAEVRRVELITIDSYLAQHPPTLPIRFIKIDVQGFERQVLIGMSQTISSQTELVVALEYGPECAVELGEDPRATIDYFIERGFLLKSLCRKTGIRPLDLKDLDSLVAETGYVDILAHTPGALGTS